MFIEKGLVHENYQAKAGREREKIFEQRFPKIFKIEKARVSQLRKDTGDIISSNKLSDSFNLVNKLVINGGFEETLIDTTKNAQVNIHIPFNSFVFPERFFKPLDVLLSSAQQTFPREFVTKGLTLIIEQQAQFREGETSRILDNAFIKKEEVLNLYEKTENKSQELFKFCIKGSGNKKQSQIEEEYRLLSQEKRIKEIEYRRFFSGLAGNARLQFVEKIKKDNNRSVVEDIATIETLCYLLDGEILNGLLIDGSNKFGYLYPDPLVDDKTKRGIIIRQKEIKKELTESY